jgi:hypothetical protein
MITLRVEWKVQDCWIGVFWRRVGLLGYDWWVCLLPCLPIHVCYRHGARREP